eukprot:COSAG05_NODE_1428_length_4911_cov_37.360141_6_plen_82_part_00
MYVWLMWARPVSKHGQDLPTDALSILYYCTAQSTRSSTCIGYVFVMCGRECLRVSELFVNERMYELVEGTYSKMQSTALPT